MLGGKPAPLPHSCFGQEQETTKKRDGVLQETRFVTGYLGSISLYWCLSPHTNQAPFQPHLVFHCKLCSHTKLQKRLPNPKAGFINHDKAVELIFIYITFQAIYINICKLCGGTSWWCTLFSCPADEMLQKNAKVSAIISELGSLFLRAFIIPV